MLPPELLASLSGIEGYDEQAFVRVHKAAETVTAVRVNPNKITGKDLSAKTGTIPWNPHGYYLAERPVFTLDPLLHSGAYYVQEAASQSIWAVLEQLFQTAQPVNVLDLCAAPGGKTTLLSSFFTNGLVVGNEVIKARCAILQENVTKWGDKNIVVTNNDPRDFQRLPGFFDVMMVDAPCSGSGLFRRDAEAISEWSLQNVLLCSKRQQRILHDAYAALKQDGILIYSTCSYSAEENEAIVDYMLEHFDVENLRLDIHAQPGIVETISSAYKGFGYRFFPHKLRTEGFFLSAFRKKSGSTFNAEKENTKWIFATAKELEAIRQWVAPDDEEAYVKVNDGFIAVAKKHLEALNVLRRELYIKKAGIEVGELKHKGLVPAHALALSGRVNAQVHNVPLDYDQALLYLRKQEMNPDLGQTGWALATYNNLPLGWLKILPNRVNNYYPTEWRILMQQA